MRFAARAACRDAHPHHWALALIARERRWRAKLRHLYTAPSPTARRFRYGLLVLDLASISWIVFASFLPLDTLILSVDMALGAMLLAEFTARHAIRERPWRTALRPLEVADFVAILTLLLSPLLQHFLGFLRVLRMLRLLNSARIASSLREDWELFRQNEEAVMAAAQLVVFLFIMTGLVFELRGLLRPDVENYGDALYFVVTALTTTGFGDYVPRDTGGRMLAVFIMLAGVTLFLRLAQALVRPRKVRHPCPSCGLQRHEVDAVHCKSCGTLINIPNDDSF